MVDQWERAAREIEDAADRGEISDAEYRKEMRMLYGELEEAAQEAYDEVMGW